MKPVWAVILAAGEGKRMCSSLPKVLHPLCGRPMLHYVLDCAAALAERVVLVTGHGGAQVRAVAAPEVLGVTQAEQKGTGHALLQALPVLPEQGKVLVLSGDTPLLQPQHLSGLVEACPDAAAAVLTAILPDPSGYGRIVRRPDGVLGAVVEEKDATAREKMIDEVNGGAYCFELKALRRLLPRINNKNVQQEFYLPAVLALMTGEGLAVALHRVKDYRVVLGVNDRGQMAEAAAVWRRRINNAHMQAGVTLLDPESTYLDYGVVVGAETLIYPQTMLEGKCRVGQGCRLGPQAHLRSSLLGDGVIVRHSVVEETVLENGSTVGPFAHLRPGCRIGAGVKVGSFVEIKNSVLEAGAKVPHLSYVGDADIGAAANLGAGVIVVNYDGRRKHRTTIAEQAFIGCNSNLVSPLHIGSGAYVAAGSTITRNVPGGNLAVARARQINRPGLAARWIDPGEKSSPAGNKETDQEK